MTNGGLTKAQAALIIAGEMPVDSETVPVGAQAPEFTLKAANDGRDVSLSDYRGRLVVLVFLRGFG